MRKEAIIINSSVYKLHVRLNKQTKWPTRSNDKTSEVVSNIASIQSDSVAVANLWFIGPWSFGEPLLEVVVFLNWVKAPVIIIIWIFPCQRLWNRKHIFIFTFQYSVLTRSTHSNVSEQFPECTIMWQPIFSEWKCYWIHLNQI